MVRSVPEYLENRLFRALPAREAKKLAARCEVLEMELRHTVFEAHRPSEYVYFPLIGVISIHTRMSKGVAVEIAAIGNEGMVGLEIFFGGNQSHASAFCQIPGRALRMEAEAFRRAVRASPPLTAVLLRYAQALLAQISQASACNRVHSIEERCARWLLMSHDRMNGNRFELTQEFLGEMLGVRRAGVSVAASNLQRDGLIRYSRGRVEVVDRAGLERVSCECYAVIAREYERLIGSPS